MNKDRLSLAEYWDTQREDLQMEVVFNWIEEHKIQHPDLGMIIHVPNGGYRDFATAKRLKRQGVKAGYPDILCDVSRHGFHGLRIEMKRKDGLLSKEQSEWIKQLTKQRYLAVVCIGARATIDTIKSYLTITGK